MEAEAEQFGQCAKHNEASEKWAAQSVALRAQVILLRFAAEVKQANVRMSDGGLNAPDLK